MYTELTCSEKLSVSFAVSHLLDLTENSVWLALGKVLLATGLIVYTIVVMLGGNPMNE
jgi:amino acid transporter